MRKYQLPALASLACMLCCQTAIGQDHKPSIDSIVDLPSFYFNKIQNKYADLDDRLTKKTEMYL